MATFIDVIEEEQAKEITKFFCKLLSQSGIKNEEVTKIYNTLLPLIPNDYETLITSILSRLDELYGGSSKKDVEACLQVLASLLLRVAQKNDRARLVETFCNLVTATSSNAESRLAILSQMFNLLAPNEPVRLSVLESMVRFAGKQGLVDRILPMVKCLPQWVKQWGLTQDQTRALLLEAIKGAQTDNLRSGDVLAIITQYLNTYELDGNPADAAETATLACTFAVQADALFQFDSLFRLKAVQALQASTNDSHRHAFNILHIFASESLPSFQSYVRDNSAGVAGLGINVKSCEDKMRLLTLASISLGKADLEYSTISTALDVDVSTVEIWVIKAINAKLLEAKINQLQKRIEISGVSRRTVEPVQWQDLKTRVTTWRENVRSVLEIIRHAQETVEQRKELDVVAPVS